MYQGARTVYCRYADTKGVELVYDLGPQPLLFLDCGLVFPGVILWEDRQTAAAHPLHAGPEYYGERRLICVFIWRGQSYTACEPKRSERGAAAMTWRALITNGTFLELLTLHRPSMEAAGFEIIPTDCGVTNLPAEQVYELAQNADVIFGPSAGLDGRLFRTAARLKVISIAASGYEAVDLAEATAAGVVVTNAPVAAGSEAVADMAWGLMLAVARSIPQRHHLLMAHRQRDRSMGIGLWGKTLGVVGLGNIGQLTARRALGFQMRILAYNRSWNASHAAFAAQYGVERVDLDTLLRQSDVVSLHLRGAEETRHILGARELALMKPAAILINTARANLVDEQALHAALSNGALTGAGLDTIADGGVESPLLDLPNVVGTPHLGNRCIDSVHEVMRLAISNALTVLHGDRPAHVVNPAVFEQPR